jgi:hypothetical protein
LLQRGVLLPSFGMVVGRRTGVHDVEQRGGFRYEVPRVLEQAIPAEKATVGEVFHGGSSEMT